MSLLRIAIMTLFFGLIEGVFQDIEPIYVISNKTILPLLALLASIVASVHLYTLLVLAHKRTKVPGVHIAVELILVALTLQIFERWVPFFVE